MEKDFLVKAIRKTAEKRESDLINTAIYSFENSHLRGLVLTIWEQKIPVLDLVNGRFKNAAMTLNFEELRDKKRDELEEIETRNLLDKISNINYVLSNMEGM